MTLHTLYVGFGANLGQPEATFSALLAHLHDHPTLHLLAHSPLYQTAPVGGPPQDDYLNAALALSTSLSPLDSLAALLDIERTFGRDRSKDIRWGPRTIDLDLLMANTSILDEEGPPRLVLPHPRMTERRFVLQPLRDIAPDVVHPLTGHTIEELFDACPDPSPVLPYKPSRQ